MYWVLSVPYWIGMLVTVLAFVMVACGAHLLVRRLVPYDDLVAHNDVAGFMISVVGVLYAVLLAFIVVIVWQQYDESESRAQAEVRAIDEIYDLSTVLPPRDAAAIRSFSQAYAAAAIDHEWPAMKRGGFSQELELALEGMQRSITQTVARTPEQVYVRNLLITRVQDVDDDRRRRLVDNATGLPGILWAALWIGGAIVIGFGFLFGVEKVPVQLLMTAAVATLVAISFVVIAELDFPFRGDAGISSSGWTVFRQSTASVR